MEFKSMDEFSKYVDRQLDKINGYVHFDDLMSDSFMANYTQCSSFCDFCIKGKVPTDPEDFKNFPDETMDEIVRRLTVFETWEEMQRKAAEYYVVQNVDK